VPVGKKVYTAALRPFALAFATATLVRCRVGRCVSNQAGSRRRVILGVLDVASMKGVGKGDWMGEEWELHSGNLVYVHVIMSLGVFNR
jgi:hypothetical protein